MAGRGGDLRAQPADAGAGPDGRRCAAEDVDVAVAKRITCRSSLFAPCGKLPTTRKRSAAPAATSACSTGRVDRPDDVDSIGVDGLLLTGGGDVLPSIYGERRASRRSIAAEPGRDEYELELVRRAVEADLPLLAICRGIQVLNVARGGTLIQDIPDEVGTRSTTRVRDSQRHDRARGVDRRQGRLLERLMRERLEEVTLPGEQPSSSGAEETRRRARRDRRPRQTA